MTSQLRYAFENLNAGKRLISLDLKTEEGKETLLALVEKAEAAAAPKKRGPYKPRKKDISN